MNRSLALYFLLIQLFTSALTGCFKGSDASTIQRMIDTARKNDRPVLVCTGTYNFFLATIDDGFVKLGKPVLPYAYTYVPVFINDGNIRMIWEGNDPTDVADTLYYLDYSLPETWPSGSGQIKFDWDEADSEDIFGMQAIARNVVKVTNDGYYQTDLITGNVEWHGFQPDKPWNIEPGCKIVIWDHLLSINNKYIVISFGEFYGPRQIWKYEIATETWTMLMEREHTVVNAVDPSGRYIAVLSSDPQPYKALFDSVTGQEIKRFPWTGKLILGYRWVLFKDTMNTGNIFLYDIEDNWKEYKLEEDEIVSSYGIAMWEPGEE